MSKVLTDEELKKAYREIRFTRTRIIRQPNLAIPFLLSASYVYYILELDPIMPDTDYDWLAAFVHQRWETLEHRHKGIIQKEWLEAGSLYKLREDEYPAMVKGAASFAVQVLNHWKDRMKNGKRDEYNVSV